MSGQDSRTRIMAATVRCAAEQGVRGFSLEDVAAAASLSRTTIYRYFPDGRDQLLSDTIRWEVGNFWARLADAVEHLPTLEDRLVAGLVIGRKLMAKSRILANLADPDVKELIEAAQPTESLIRDVIRSYMQAQIEAEIAAGRLKSKVPVELSADYLARMAFSWMGNSPNLDLSNEDEVRRLVQVQFLAALR
ncbi:MAG: TetR/AcrR family transcriptional regulator [Microthrixaceae bacterium]